ncbi:unnamed protein product [Boreogadus saida]
MTPVVIKDGEYTATIYRLIKECRYGDAIVILNHQLEKHMKSRAALSLLGYCCFHTQDFSAAADCYEQLGLLHPEVEEYRLYHAQALARACCYPEAMKASFLLDNPSTYTRHFGTLYCAKGNYDFGISRVIKSLEPYNKKLGTDTWFYAKRCVLSLLENMSKHMILLRDAVVQDCLLFLERCEVYGREEPAVIQAPLQDERASSSSSSSLGRNSVTYEARLLKALFYQVVGWNE